MGLKNPSTLKAFLGLFLSHIQDPISRVKGKKTPGLVLREIASRENLVTPEKDLDSQVDKILLEASEEDRKKTSRADLKEHIFGRLQNEMVLALLENLK